MRILSSLLITCMSAALVCLPVAGNAMPSQDVQDPMQIPPGMQAVPVSPSDLPAGVDPRIVQQQQTTQPAPAPQVQAQMQPQAMPVNDGNTTMQQQQAQAQQPQQQVPAQAIQPAPQQMQAAQPQNNTAPIANAQQQAAAPMDSDAQPMPASQPVPAPQPAAQPQPEPAASNTMALPLSISHGITYLTGGTNQADIAQLKALDGEFNLQLLYAAKNGDHLVNYMVRILDYHNFELVSAHNVGPYFYLHISPGDYVMEVTYEKDMKPVQMKIKVPAKDRLRKTIILK